MSSQTRRCLACIATVAGVLFVAVQIAAANSWYTATPNGLQPKEVAAAVSPELNVAVESDTRLEFTVQVDGFCVDSFKTADGVFAKVTFPNAAISGQVGDPAIPVIRKIIVAPTGAVVKASVTSADDEVELDSAGYGQALVVAPVRAPIPKVPGAAAQARYLRNRQAYSTDAFSPSPQVVVSEMGIVRGERLMLVEVRPVTYNPVQQSLRLCPQISVAIDFENAPPQVVPHSPWPGLSEAVLNPTQLPTGKSQDGNYLIIVASQFAGDLTDFVDAKTAQGFKVTTWTAAAGATTTQIKNYIATQWADPQNAPDYILLVGDTNTIPNWIGGGEGTPATDLPYTCMDGASDWFPDIAIGRFPVRTSAQLAAVIDKTLYIENGPLADPSYLSRAVFMASEDNYTVSESTHEYCISTYMEPNNFEVEKLYSHTYNATTQQVRDAFNSGRIFGIYSGHGSETSWADGPPFSQSDVNGLTNANMYSFVCSFACVTGTYTNTECYTETWILTPNKGAAAIWGSSVNSYWTEDDVLQRRLFDVLYSDYIRELGPAFNQTRVNFAAEMGTGATTQRYFEMYNLLGDPSLLIADAEAALRVSPSGAFYAEGPEGGPFAPAGTTYTLRNVSDAAIDYEVTHDPAATWVTLSGTLSGTLAPGATLDITATINAAAISLPIGMHSDTISFVNTTDHVGDSTRDLMLEVGRYVFNATDVPQAISDNSTITSVLNVGQHFCIGDVNVTLDLTHTYVGDLVVTLQSPSGKLVTLHDRSGGSSENLQLTYDDEGTPPEGPGTLADFDRESPLGQWTLTVSDEAGGDTGTLNGWALRILPLGDVCPPAVSDVSVQTPANMPATVSLVGMTEGAGPLDFTIETLPTNGILRDAATNEVIDAVPYTLSGAGNVVRYQPAMGFNGINTFDYFASDDTGTSGTATVSIDVGGPELLYRFDLSSNPGWTTTGMWAYGRPSGGGSHNLDPTGGYTGANVYGYNLAGDYPDDMTSTMYLTTKGINCGNATDVELRFRRWLGVESSSYDHANIQVSNDYTTWVTVWEHDGPSISDTSWTLQTYDISAVADNHPGVIIRWGMGGTDGSVTYPGWNIDDVEIWGRLPSSVVFGDMNCDGVVDVDDAGPFALSLVDGNAYAAAYPDCTANFGDMNGDTILDGRDISDFVNVLLGH